MPDEDPPETEATPLDGATERYRWLGEVSRGGVGIIVGARDPVIGRRVAVKMLRPELASDSRVLSEFSEEARITGQLDHPNIVPVYDFGQEGKNPFMVMKLIAGKSLAKTLSESHGELRSPTSLRRLVQIVMRLCDALSFAHSRGVTHCDLKPENVMVGDHGQVYLMDWGMALVKSTRAARGRVASTPESAADSAAFGSGASDDSFVELPSRTDAATEPPSGSARGTPAYMAPEQIFGLVEQIDERTDVFGLGGILCEMLTGQPPNNQRTLAGVGTVGVSRSSPTANELWTQLPPALSRITRRALAPKREDRYPSVAALRDDLEQFLQGGGWFETRDFADGEVIVAEGDAGDTAYILESGYCEVFKQIGGQKKRLRRLGPGDVFGEMAIFTGGIRTATVLASGPVTLKVITGSSLNQELDQNPWVATFVRSLARLVRDSEEREQRASRPPAPEGNAPE